MEKFNKARKLFGSLDFSSDSSNNSVIYISSDEETSEGWDSDWSTDTEELVRRVETQVQARPIPIAGRKLTTASDEPGPSTVSPNMQTTPKLDKKYFDEKLCYAPTRGNTKRRIELCKTILPVLESPLSPPAHERGPSMDTPLLQPENSGFHASFHIQNALPYTDISTQRCTSCMVCGKSVDEIKAIKVTRYMEASTPRSEPAYITALRKEAYINGLNAGSLLFIAPAVSQAAACDGTRISTTAVGQDVAPGTLPIY